MLSITRDMRVMRGGSQAHLMQASDGNFYIVKFQDNPQGTKVLANEMLASRIAGHIGLPMPRAEIVYLPQGIADGIAFETIEGKSPIRSGLHCGLRTVVSPFAGRMYETLPPREERAVRNRSDLIGARLFDFWTLNRDLRQWLYWKRSAEKKFSICFIDNGHCFGGPDWAMDHAHPPIRIFDPADLMILHKWMNRLAAVTLDDLFMIASELPGEWYGNDRCALNALLCTLAERSIASINQCSTSVVFGNSLPAAGICEAC
jgi:HipA-like kinase